MSCSFDTTALSVGHRPASRVLTAAVLVLIAIWGCTGPRRQRDDDRIPVALPADGAVRSVHPSLVLSPSVSRTLVEEALEASTRFVVVGQEEQGIAARMSFVVSDGRLAPPTEEDADVIVNLRLEYRPPLSTEHELLVVNTTREAADGVQAFEVALESALGELLHRLRERARSDEELVSELSARDPHRRLAALDELAGRRHPAAVPALWELLETGDDVLAAGALTRLVAFSPPGLARRIIDQAEHRGFAFLLQAIHALGAVGGEESLAYLYLLESGHSDPRVLAAARGALDSLERRRSAARSDNPEVPEADGGGGTETGVPVRFGEGAASGRRELGGADHRLSRTDQ